jgi:uncharacterized phage-associated protein
MARLHAEGGEFVTHASDVAADLRAHLGPSLGCAELHKLLYLCQAWHATWTQRPLFVETIEAWQKGPVVADLWWAEQQDFPPATSSDGLDRLGCATVEYVLSRYGHLNGNELINLTHEPGPWQDAYRHGQNTRIEVNAMIEHFAQDAAADQAWFWDPEWQAGEREADQDIRHGRVTRYASADDFIASL